MGLPVIFKLNLRSPEATTELAEQIAPLLIAGDTLLLTGELGAGKTHFARALIQTRLHAVGLAEDVPSPTYTLVQTYSDLTCDIWHADLYRLTDTAEVVELGLPDAFTQAICLVEWPDRLSKLAPRNALSVDLQYANAAGMRIARFSWLAPDWDKLIPVFENHNV